jgi:ribose/xylose/arabinose/galactoside ABC-type transport system permease subunit
VANRNFVWVLLVLLVVAATVANPVFLTPANMVNILVAAVSLGCLTLAQAIVLITGHMDLSTEANLIFTSIVAGIMLIPPPTGQTLAPGGLGVPWPLVIPVMFAVSASIGLANGLMVTKLNMNPFMTTLAMLVGLSGLSLVIGQGRHIINLDLSFRWAGSGTLGPIPVSVIVLVLTFIAVALMLNRTRFGRYLYAVGSNRAATRAAGVDDQRVIILAYVICGLLVGLAAFLLVGRLGTAGANIASGQLFISIAAAVLGGVSLFGGRGTVLGLLGGLLLMGTITNALNIAQIPSTLTNVVYGAVILVAVFVDALRVRRSAPG